MKVYIVEHSYGTFDNYKTYVGKAFLKEESAKKYKEEFDRKHIDFNPPIPEIVWDDVTMAYYERHINDEPIEDYQAHCDNEAYVTELHNILTKEKGYDKYTLKEVKDMIYYDESLRWAEWNSSAIVETELIEE